MKELEKTNRILIASIVTVLILIIALLMFNKPKHSYKINSAEVLEKVISEDYFISLNEINNNDYVLIDTRSLNEFEMGSLNSALHIYTPEMLSDSNIEKLNKIKNENKIMVLFGQNPHEVNVPYLLLYQLGFQNVKILLVENNFINSSLISENVVLEKYENDITSFITASIKKAAEQPKIKPVIKKAQPKIITPKVKEKMVPTEGGC